MLPKYINCENREFQYCHYFIHRDCPETCAYAKDIVGNRAEKGLVEKVEN